VDRGAAIRRAVLRPTGFPQGGFYLRRPWDHRDVETPSRRHHWFGARMESEFSGPISAASERAAVGERNESRRMQQHGATGHRNRPRHDAGPRSCGHRSRERLSRIAENSWATGSSASADGHSRSYKTDAPIW